jgi:hypothetical protein
MMSFTKIKWLNKQHKEHKLKHMKLMSEKQRTMAMAMVQNPGTL